MEKPVWGWTKAISTPYDMTALGQHLTHAG